MNIETHAFALAGYAALGLALGAAHFALLRRNTALWLCDGRRAGALLLQLLRVGVMAGAFWLLARRGAAPLLAAFAGFLAARGHALRGARP